MNPDNIPPAELGMMLSLLTPDHVLVTAARLGIEVGMLRAGRPLIGDDLADDYVGGSFHREHPLSQITELQKLRWPPTGDRAEWIIHGPAGPTPVETVESVEIAEDAA